MHNTLEHGLLLTRVGKWAQAPVVCLLITAGLDLELVQPELVCLVLRLVQLAGLRRVILQTQGCQDTTVDISDWHIYARWRVRGTAKAFLRQDFFKFRHKRSQPGTVQGAGPSRTILLGPRDDTCQQEKKSPKQLAEMVPGLLRWLCALVMSYTGVAHSLLTTGRTWVASRASIVLSDSLPAGASAPCRPLTWGERLASKAASVRLIVTCMASGCRTGSA